MNCIYVDRERALEGTGTSGAAAIVQTRLLRAAAAHAGHEEADCQRPVLLFPGAPRMRAFSLRPAWRHAASVVELIGRPILISLPTSGTEA